MTKSTALWNKDGKGGADDPNTSEKILLDWLRAEGNYRNYRGSKNGGHTKEYYAKQIQSLLEANQVRAKRHVRHITMKIADWEKKFSQASEWANSQTGQGLQENDPPTFEAAVKGKFKYYYELLEIFGDRGKHNPWFTTSNMDGAPNVARAAVSRKTSTDLTSSSDDDDEVQVVPPTTLFTDSSKKRAVSTASVGNTKKSKAKKGGGGLYDQHFEDLFALLKKNQTDQMSSRAIGDAKTETEHMIQLMELKERMEKSNMTPAKIVELAPQLSRFYPQVNSTVGTTKTTQNNSPDNSNSDDNTSL
jgi:hypothetical protein